MRQPRTDDLSLLFRAESTASAMEQQLTVLESKLDDLLAEADGASCDTAAEMLRGAQSEAADNKHEDTQVTVVPLEQASIQSSVVSGVDSTDIQLPIEGIKA